MSFSQHPQQTFSGLTCIAICQIIIHIQTLQKMQIPTVEEWQILTIILPLPLTIFKSDGLYSLRRFSSLNLKSRISGGDMNGSIVEVVMCMGFSGWKMHHLLIISTQMILWFFKSSSTSGISMSQPGIQIRDVLLLQFILLLVSF